MSLKRNYLNKFILVTEKAAIGSFFFIGKGDKNAADKGAVDSMRTELNKLDIDGTVVIGEGEMDEAPMLFIGENLGTKKGQAVDIAVDPLEGTNFVAKNLPNSISVLAVTEKNNLFSAPDTYMEKISYGSNLPKNLLDLDNSVEKNISLLAEAKKVSPEELTVCIIDRERHRAIIEKLQKLKVKISLISDGDVLGAMSVVDNKSKNDLYLGIGGGPEGVLAAAALSCLGGQMQTRLVLDSNQKTKAEKLGLKNLNHKYNVDDMIKGDVIFCATGVTTGYFLNGVINKNDFYETNTFALHKSENVIKKVTNQHKK